jgi:hypothetical protein
MTSTRATSPSSSTGSSEETMGLMMQRKQPAKGEAVSQRRGGTDPDTLACRRGRSVLMLSELVIDVDTDGLPGASASASGESASSVGALSSSAAGGNSTRCTPCTPQILSSSPPPVASTGGIKIGDGAAPTALLPPLPPLPACDASQRSHARKRFGGAVGGDASQRKPGTGRVSLGVAVIGGDASQRSPPGCLDRTSVARVAVIGGVASQHSPPFAHLCSATTAAQQDLFKSWPTDNFPSQACDTSCGGQQGITSTCPTASTSDSSLSSLVKDASQRDSVGAVPTVLKVHGCNDALKSWLSGASGNGTVVDTTDLADRLRAAAPDSYED